MPKNINPKQYSKNADNSMTKYQFTFKLTRPSANLENDPSVMKNQFHLEFDKTTRTLGDAEPVYKPRKKRLPPLAPSETNAPNKIKNIYITTLYHPYSSASGTPSGLYTNASSPTFFKAAQNRDHIPSTHNLDASVIMPTKAALIPSIKAEKIKISNLINAEMIDEKKLDISTINILAKTFNVSAENLETELSTAIRW